MTIVANSFSYVIGADTHARTHTLAVIEVNTAARVDTQEFSTATAGLSRALAWIKRRTENATKVLIAIEGIGSYGARLARVYQRRSEERRVGKECRSRRRAEAWNSYTRNSMQNVVII